MTAAVLFTSILLQQQQTFHLKLNFTEIGFAWNSDALYVLYNKDTLPERFISDTVDHILENGKGYFAQKPCVITDLRSSERRLRDLGTFTVKSLVVVIMHDTLDPAWERAHHIMRRIKAACTIFVVKKGMGAKHVMQRFFFRLQKKQFTRVLVVEPMKQQLFAMNVYPKLKIINVTDKLATEYFPPLENWNLQGFTLKVPVQMDVPNIFWYYDSQIKRIRLDGLGGRLFEEFMAAMNVTLDVYPLYVNGLNFMNISHIEEMIMRDEIEISPHIYTTFESKDLQYSYPYTTTPRCIMLPVDNEKFFKFKPVIWNIWPYVVVFLVISEIICHLVMRYLGPWRYQAKYRVFRTPGAMVYNIVCILIGFPSPDRKIFIFHNVSMCSFLRTLLIYSMIIIAGFGFSQIYSTSLTSKLAASLSFGLHFSPTEILNMDIPIMVIRSDAKFLLDVPGFGRLISTRLQFASSYEEFHKNRMSFNASFMYPISRERWSILKGQQHHLKVKLFWLSDVCYGGYPVQYQMRYDSYFLPYLTKFTLYIRESGLYSHWRGLVLRRAVQLGHLQYKEQNPTVFEGQKREIVMSSMLRLMVYVFHIGLFLSGVVLGLELLHKKLRQTRTVAVKVRTRAGRPLMKFDRF